MISRKSLCSRVVRLLETSKSVSLVKVQKIDFTKVKTTFYSDSSIISLTMILVGRDFQCRKSEGRGRSDWSHPTQRWRTNLNRWGLSFRIDFTSCRRLSWRREAWFQGSRQWRTRCSHRCRTFLAYQCLLSKHQYGNWRTREIQEILNYWKLA